MQEKKTETQIFFSRVENLKISRGWTWADIAKKLDLTRVMLHYIKQGKYGISKRNLFMLEKLEREEGVGVSNAKELIEGVNSSVEESKVVIAPADFDRGYIDVPVKYARGEPPKGYPRIIRLARPDTKTAAKLIVALKIDEDPERVLFACIENEKYKARDFINLLTPFSFQALMDVAEKLTFGAHWKAP